MFEFIRKAADRIPKLRLPNSKWVRVGEMWPWLSPFANSYGYDTAKVSWNTYYQAMDNVWVDACITAYVMEILAAGFKVTTGDTEQDNESHVDYLTELFTRPDGLHGRTTFTVFQWKTISSVLGPGDCFIEVAEDESVTGFPSGLYYIPPHLINYHPDTDQYGLVGTDIRYEDDELLHPNLPDIKNEIWGKSKIDKIATDITGDVLSWKFNREYFKQGGMHPRNVISFDGMNPDEIKAEQDRMLAASKRNPRGTLFTSGKFQDISLSNRDMEFGALTDRVRDRILAGYGVPPQKVGIIESGNLGSGSGDSQNRDFKKKIKGMLKLFEDEYKKISDGWLGWDEHFQYGTLDLDDATTQTNIDNTRLNNGSVTINEIRKRDGLPSVSWGDEPYKMPGSSIKLVQDQNTTDGQKHFKSLSEMHGTDELIRSNNKLAGIIEETLAEIQD